MATRLGGTRGPRALATLSCLVALAVIPGVGLAQDSSAAHAVAGPYMTVPTDDGNQGGLSVDEGAPDGVVTYDQRGNRVGGSGGGSQPSAGIPSSGVQQQQGQSGQQNSQGANQQDQSDGQQGSAAPSTGQTASLSPTSTQTASSTAPQTLDPVTDDDEDTHKVGFFRRIGGLWTVVAILILLGVAAAAVIGLKRSIRSDREAERTEDAERRHFAAEYEHAWPDAYSTIDYPEAHLPGPDEVAGPGPVDSFDHLAVEPGDAVDLPALAVTQPWQQTQVLEDGYAAPAPDAAPAGMVDRVDSQGYGDGYAAYGAPVDYAADQFADYESAPQTPSPHIPTPEQWDTYGSPSPDLAVDARRQDDLDVLGYGVPAATRHGRPTPAPLRAAPRRCRVAGQQALRVDERLPSGAADNRPAA